MAATDETEEEARNARPHTVVMPDGTRHDCAGYQEAWLRRNVEAWALGLNPLDCAIEDGKGKRADVTLEEAVAAKHPGAKIMQISGLQRTP